MTEAEFKKLLTPEFMETLLLAVEYCNWSVDMVETIDFHKWCCEVAGIPIPEGKEYTDKEFDRHVEG